MSSWSPTRSVSASSTEDQWFANGLNVVRIFYDNSTSIKYSWSGDEGTSFSTPVTVDSTAGDNDVMLNCAIAYDSVTGRLHFLYARNTDTSGSPAVLVHRYTDNPFNTSPTFSAEHIIDAGSGHGNNRFYRVALWAFNGNVSLHYTSDSASTFTQDGLWRTLSSDGGATWSTPATVYTSTVVNPAEPNVAGFTDGSVIVSWYDPGALTNTAGDIWICKSSDGGATWSSSATKLTTTTNYGRPRIACDNGTWWIVANRPWNSGSPVSDVYTLTSTDNGTTWGTPTLRQSHSSGDLDHPDIIVVDQFVGILWVDTAFSPAPRNFIYSTDGGATFSSAVSTLTVSNNSDAPRLLATTNYIISKGYSSTSILATNPFFAITPLTQTSVQENFNGFTAGAAINTGNWTTTNVSGTSGALKATGTAAVRNSPATVFDRAGSYWNPSTYTGNVEAFFSIISDGSGGEADLYLWNPSTLLGYDINGATGDFGNIHSINRKDPSGTNVSLTINNSITNWVSGDKICLQIIGTELVYWLYRSGAWIELTRIVDNTYRSGLKAEIQIAGNTNAGPTVDDFGIGTLSSPSNSAAPSASGTVSVGNTLSVTKGTWTNSPQRYTYQWQTSPDGTTWTSVSLATLPTFTVADGSKQHRCQVTGYNAVGSTTANSNALTSGGSPPTNTVAPAVTGTAQVGQTLTTTSGTWV